MLGKGRSSVLQMNCTTALRIAESPSVTMISEITGSPIMGRSTSRSVRIPSAAEKTRVSRKATAKGSSYCTARVRHT
jgi:hypothetical protein